MAFIGSLGVQVRNNCTQYYVDMFHASHGLQKYENQNEWDEWIVNELTLDVTDDEFPVFCDMKNGGETQHEMNWTSTSEAGSWKTFILITRLFIAGKPID